MAYRLLRFPAIYSIDAANGNKVKDNRDKENDLKTEKPKRKGNQHNTKRRREQKSKSIRRPDNQIDCRSVEMRYFPRNASQVESGRDAKWRQLPLQCPLTMFNPPNSLTIICLSMNGDGELEQLRPKIIFHFHLHFHLMSAHFWRKKLWQPARFLFVTFQKPGNNEPISDFKFANLLWQKSRERSTRNMLHISNKWETQQGHSLLAYILFYIVYIFIFPVLQNSL